MGNHQYAAWILGQPNYEIHPRVDILYTDAWGWANPKATPAERKEKMGSVHSTITNFRKHTQPDNLKVFTLV